jgi:hypothetical protein
MFAFLLKEFTFKPVEIHGVNFSYEVFRREVNADFGIEIMSNEVQLGYVYEHPEPQEKPVFVPIRGLHTFRNVFSLICNATLAPSTLVLSSPPIIHLHIFYPKLESIDVAMAVMPTEFPTRPPSPSQPVLPSPSPLHQRDNQATSSQAEDADEQDDQGDDIQSENKHDNTIDDKIDQELVNRIIKVTDGDL